MRKVEVFVDAADVEETVVSIARLGVVDLSSDGTGEEWRREEAGRWDELAGAYRRQAQKLAGLLDTLGIEVRGDQPLRRLRPSGDEGFIAERVDEAARPVEAWRARRAAAERLRDCLGLLRDHLRLMAPIGASVEELREPAHLHLRIGVMPAEQFENLDMVLYRVPVVVLPIHEKEGRVLFAAATSRDHGPVLDRTLQGAFARLLELPGDLSGPVPAAAEELEARLERVSRQLEELDRERKGLAQEWGTRLPALWVQADADARVADIVGGLDRHGDTYRVSGWVAASSLDEVVGGVETASGGRADVEVVEPPRAGRRPVPTRLHNPRFLRPFERLVGTFGLPSYDEIDPTPVVAATFVLMYGVMFGDIGHGILLGLAGLGVRLRFRGSAVADLGTIIATCGASGALFGVVYGSVFGLERLMSPLWLSPLESIRSILVVSVVAGVVLLNLGFLLNLVAAIGSKRWGGALFGENGLAGIWLYWALIGSAWMLMREATLPVWLWLALVVAPVVLVFLSRPLERLIDGRRPLVEGGWGEYSVQSAFEVFETVISDISNSLSFVRLGAFAVAHGGLSMVVLSVAERSGGVWYWLVVLLGTVVIVLFEGLIVGIQALRLEYYEFFSKFFRGRGRAFRPLHLYRQETI